MSSAATNINWKNTLSLVLTLAFGAWAWQVKELKNSVTDATAMIRSDLTEIRRELREQDDAIHELKEELGEHKVQGANRRSVFNGRLSRIEERLEITHRDDGRRR